MSSSPTVLQVSKVSIFSGTKIQLPFWPTLRDIGMVTVPGDQIKFKNAIDLGDAGVYPAGPIRYTRGLAGSQVQILAKYKITILFFNIYTNTKCKNMVLYPQGLS